MEKSVSLTFKDFPFICRACLNTKGLKPFDEIYDLLKLFEAITNIQIEFEVNLPRNICADCLDFLQKIMSFIYLSQRSDIILKQLLEKRKPGILTEEISLDSSLTEAYQCDANEYDGEMKTEPEDNIKCEAISVCPESTTNLKQSYCDISGQIFATKNELSEHQKDDVRSSKKAFKCMNCEKAFVSKCKLTLHMRSHTKETPFQCNICGKKFSQSSNLKRHDDTVHKGLKPFKCDVCGKEFATFLRKTEHLRVHTGERPYTCAYCGLSFKKHSNHYAHEIRHKIKNGEIPKSEKKPKRYPRKKPDNPSDLKCSICNKIFSTKYVLAVHTQIHIGEKSFLCTVCGKGFLRKSHLDVHIRIHTGEKPYECNHCGKHFRQPACFRNHLLIHKGERSHKCQVCQRSFIQLAHLQSHIKVHTGEKPYKCTYCNKCFAQNGNLKAHIRIHTGERPYRCSICLMAFCDSNSMKRHKKSHGSTEDTKNCIYK